MRKQTLIKLLKIIDVAIILTLFIVGLINHDGFYLLSAIIWDLLGSNKE